MCRCRYVSLYPSHCSVFSHCRWSPLMRGSGSTLSGWTMCGLCRHRWNWSLACRRRAVRRGLHQNCDAEAAAAMEVRMRGRRHSARRSTGISFLRTPEALLHWWTQTQRCSRSQKGG
ncbi:hypothetical protein TraAM80_03722 [Trypanosoma rangeli]|uniref:Uncharacterized protein n=1 Tax=Trypanosoma rangeli TaxID=5698 RepID=A0A422NNB2_TRYRA|nr:uncharacterized protein TraAM80_03722 [Trypanosoma rangeli]RNF06906.1 hypothetical protein TraAM80_03722 [Trypanosoma rangeli]|eukprot:RNF06906.1 hypothetical protein TraAM80_03722 [Trypanosoma rangeli]